MTVSSTSYLIHNFYDHSIRHSIVCVTEKVSLNKLQTSLYPFRVFWNVALRCHVEVDRRFSGAYYLYHQAPMMEAVRTSETSLNFNATTRRYISQDSKLYTRLHENLKSHKLTHIITKSNGLKLFHNY
jgi:hypothetical protein